MTGGNAGIGYATARQLARQGAHVIVACRSKERGEAAVEVRIGVAGKEEAAGKMREGWWEAGRTYM